jgi:hypothetical protein
MPTDLRDITREIYRQAKELGVYPPNATRLVKLVYLADIAWRQGHGGEPLSILDWRFHLYGPYADQFSDLLGGPDAEAVELVDGRSAKQLRFEAHELENPATPESVAATLRKVVKEWGDTNLNLLLNHVYFNTEPMMHARRGDILDFSNVRPLKNYTLRIDPKKLQRLQAEMNEHAKRLNLTRDGIHVSAVNLEGTRIWEEDEGQITLPPGTSGTVL